MNQRINANTFINVVDAIGILMLMLLLIIFVYCKNFMFKPIKKIKTLIRENTAA
ncbi:hypothetical protein ACFIJ5_16600 [Haloimpatiens sp. FM7330]|uniref:hypothetical protein n=1 Tax=Haloimpatiens sp. FM7330 TaxID=3298610 RepID=UPI00362C2595